MSVPLFCKALNQDIHSTPPPGTIQASSDVRGPPSTSIKTRLQDGASTACVRQRPPEIIGRHFFLLASRRPGTSPAGKMPLTDRRIRGARNPASEVSAHKMQTGRAPKRFRRCLAASGIARAAFRALSRGDNATGLPVGDPRPEEECLIDALPLRRTGRMKAAPMQRG